MGQAAKKTEEQIMDSGAVSLIPEKLNPVEVYDSGMPALLAKIRETALSEVRDIATVAGRKNIASLAYKVARSKTFLDTMGAKLAEDARKTVDTINAKRKTARDTLEALQEEIRQPLTDWENKDRDRMAGHEQAIAGIEQAGKLASDNWIALSVETMRRQAEHIRGDNRDYEEFSSRHRIVADNTLKALNEAIDKKTKHEKDQADLEILRKAEAERVQKERDDRVAKEAADKARAEAEAEAARKAKEEAERAAAAQKKADDERRAAEEREKKAKQDKEDAERRAKEAEDRREREAKESQERAERERKSTEERVERERKEAADVERRRAEKEKRDAEDAASKREADKKHHAKINNEAMAGIIRAMESVQPEDVEGTAKAIVTALAKGEIPHTKISY